MSEDHRHRELLESIQGISEIFRDSPYSRDFDHYEAAKSELIAVRLARLEERMVNIKLLLGALGFALSVLASSIAILAQ